jgi:hypothetical protein
MKDITPQGFLRTQLFAMTLGATVQRNKVYISSIPDAGRAEFRSALRAALESCTDKYLTPLSDAAHEEIICSIASSLSVSHGHILESGRFRIGTAQKALNLWLKFLWCANQLPIQPPHCPFDRIIIQLLPVAVRNYTWTTLDSISEYQALVAAARQVAGPLSLAQWELRAYNPA